MDAIQVTNHFVLVPTMGYSHIRPILRFAIDCLRVHPSVVITFLITELTTPHLQREILLHPADTVAEFAPRWRLVETGGQIDPGSGPAEEASAFGKTAEEAFRDLLRGNRQGEGRFRAIPCCVIYDVHYSSFDALF